MSFVSFVPIDMIRTITTQQVGLNVIIELIIDYTLPGRLIAMMMLKTREYITMVQALQFTSDFKLGHYMKIPPRPMFWCQVVATVIAGTVQLAVQAWMFSNIGRCYYVRKGPRCLCLPFQQMTCARRTRRTDSLALTPRCSLPLALSGVSSALSCSSLTDKSTSE